MESFNSSAHQFESKNKKARRACILAINYGKLEIMLMERACLNSDISLRLDWLPTKDLESSRPAIYL